MIVFPDPNVETEYTDPNGSVWEFNGTGWVRKLESSSGDGWVLGPVPETSKVWAWDTLASDSCTTFGVGLYDVETQSQEFLTVINSRPCRPLGQTSAQTDRAGNLYIVLDMVDNGNRPEFVRVNFDGSGYKVLGIPLDAPTALPVRSTYDGKYIYWFFYNCYWIYSPSKDEFVDWGTDFPNIEDRVSTDGMTTKYIPDLDRFYSFDVRRQALLSYTLDGGWVEHALTRSDLSGTSATIRPPHNISYRNIEGVNSGANNIIQGAFHTGHYSAKATSETLAGVGWGYVDTYYYGGNIGWSGFLPSSLKLDPQKLADTISDIEPENPDDLHIWHDTKSKAFFRYDAEGESWFQLTTEQDNDLVERGNMELRITPNNKMHMALSLNSLRNKSSKYSSQTWWDGRSFGDRNISIYDAAGAAGADPTFGFYDFSTSTLLLDNEIYRLNAFNQQPITLLGSINHPDSTGGVAGRSASFTDSATEIMFHGYEA